MMILAPYVQGRKGEQRDVFETMRRDGFVRVRVDGEIRSLDEDIRLNKNQRHTLEAVVDRLITGKTASGRLQDSVEIALRLGEGVLVVLVENSEVPGGWQEETMSEHLACLDCGVSYGELLPRNFSFNSPYGACPTCHGLGNRLVFVPERVIPDPSLSIRKGAVPLWRRGPRRLIIYYNHLLRCLAAHYGFELKTPWKELPQRIRNILLYGSGDEAICFDYWRRGRKYNMTKPFEGIIPNLMRRFSDTESEAVRDRLRQAMDRELCPDCNGARLRPEFLAVTIRDLSIHDFCSLSVNKAFAFM